MVVGRIISRVTVSTVASVELRVNDNAVVCAGLEEDSSRPYWR